MLKIPKIEVEVRYTHISMRPALEIVYLKDHLGIYKIHVYAVLKEGKSIHFYSGESDELRRFFLKKLPKQDVATRVKAVKKIIRRLEKDILQKELPYLGTFKIKHNPFKKIKL